MAVISRRLGVVFLAFLLFAAFGILTLLRRDDGVLLRPTKWGQPQDGLDFRPAGNTDIEIPTGIVDLSHLEKHSLTPKFEYRRRTIKVKAVKGKRETLTKLNAPLFNPPQTLDANQLRDSSIDPLPPLTLEVPSSPEVNTAIASFGIATTAERLPQAFPNLQHWLSNTSSLLHVAASNSDPEKPADLSDLQAQLRGLSINATVALATLPFSKAYFSLVKELYESRTPETQWLVLIDDDTFVPSLPALLNHLNTAYDSSQEVLISAISDNIKQIHIFGLQPFGGGGIFISVPLAAFLTSPKIWNSCMESTSGQGDQLLNECIQAHSAVRPIFDQGLNQMDIGGNYFVPAGYLESGRPMLTVHHWRSWFWVDMPAVGSVAKVCGYEGVLMRWLFEGDLVLANGYSIAEYPKGMEDVDLSAVEQTWGGERGEYIHRIGPLREKLGREQKRSFGMKESVVLKEGVRQTYIDMAEVVEEKKVGVDSVVELIWLF
ncbi:hypothetical protein LSUE1_G007813 [Lachnellula suecica]|uniref:Fringe-like glycosyltransferase domain-containing protein n=1 Tax=Lachnellula suecica TaxID=602035 RepID=A0A8T9C2K2_9HELO|nr:hypothetical protein LSUE1_G007813 [Lachnellula suecica]